MAVTRLDVARAAEVSPSVVSYVLNNGPRPVAPATRARVEDAIARLGYKPNAIASALRGGSTRSIGFLFPDPRNSFYSQLSQAIEQEFSERSYLVLTGNTYYDRAREERYLQSFLSRKVDGLIFSSGISIAATIGQKSDRPPVIVLDELPPTVDASSISTQDVSDVAFAVEHLQRHGHALIGCIGGPPHVPVEAARVSGWRLQQTRAGLPAGDELVAFAEPSEEGGYSVARLLLGEHGRPWAVHGRRPTALFTSSDTQAVGAISACYELGLRVPEDVAIVSLGGTKPAGYAIPPLTTMRQDVGYIAAAAAKNLLARIEDPLFEPARIGLRGNLVVGRSCGCAVVPPSAEVPAAAGQTAETSPDSRTDHS